MNVPIDKDQDVTEMAITAQSSVGEVLSRLEGDSSNAWVSRLVNNVPGTAVYRLVSRADGSVAFEYMSEAIEALSGYSISEVLEDAGRLFFSVHAEDAERLFAAQAKSLETGEIFDELYRFWHKDGSLRWIRSRSRPVKREDGMTIWDGTLIDETVIQEALEAKRRAEKALFESERRLRHALEATHDAVWELHIPTSEAFISDAFFQFSGYDRADLPPTIEAWASLTHPDDVEMRTRITEEHLRGLRPNTDHTYRLRHKLGHYIWLHCRGKVVERDEQGRPIRMAGILSDITHQKHLEEELGRLAMVARETSDCVIITDKDHRVLWANEATTRMSGYSREELLGKVVIEFVKIEETIPDPRVAMFEQLGRKQPYSTSLWAYRKNGERIRIEFELQPFFNEYGEVTHHVGITRDMTARAIAEEKLKASEEHLLEAQQVARIGSWRFDVHTRQIQWSEQLFRILGRDLAAGSPTLEEFLRYLHIDDQAKLKGFIERALNHGESYVISMRATRADGQEVHLFGKGQVRRDANMNVVELYGTTQDITEQVLAEKERLELQDKLASAQRFESLGLLAGGIAHDFNNLLMGVRMEASVLLNNPHAPIAECVGSIQEAAKRMAELTGQLLAYAGRGQFVLEKIDPNRIVADMLKLLQRNMRPTTTLETEISATPTTLEMDGSQLRQVIMNLVINAEDSLQGEPGQLAVRTRNGVSKAGTNVWVLEVTDSGCGIDEKIRQRIFDPFFTTKQAGRGLGLSTVHGIVQRCNGKIELLSTPGHGTTFRICFPLVRQSANETGTSVVEASTVRTMRVLLADDETTVRRSLRRMLELQNATIHEVGDGKEAIEALETAPSAFDLLLLDVVMPEKNGYEVLAYARENHPAIKIVLMSGYSHWRNISEVDSKRRPDAALQKPFDWETLERTIQSLFEASTNIGHSR